MNGNRLTSNDPWECNLLQWCSRCANIVENHSEEMDVTCRLYFHINLNMLDPPAEDMISNAWNITNLFRDRWFRRLQSLHSEERCQWATFPFFFTFLAWYRTILLRDHPVCHLILSIKQKKPIKCDCVVINESTRQWSGSWQLRTVKKIINPVSLKFDRNFYVTLGCYVNIINCRIVSLD